MEHRGIQAVLIYGHLFTLTGCAWGPAATLRLAPDARVRLTEVPSSARAAGRTLEGTLARAEGDVIVVRPDGPGAEWAVPIAGVDHLEIRQRRSNAGKGANIGAAVGLTVGIIAGLAGGEDCSRGGSFICFEPEALAAMLGLTGAVSGALLGSIIGALTPPAERWQPVPIGRPQLPVGGQGNRKMTVGVRFTF